MQSLNSEINWGLEIQNHDGVWKLQSKVSSVLPPVQPMAGKSRAKQKAEGVMPTEEITEYSEGRGEDMR